jgi:hypothetical protein
MNQAESMAIANQNEFPGNPYARSGVLLARPQYEGAPLSCPAALCVSARLNEAATAMQREKHTTHGS